MAGKAGIKGISKFDEVIVTFKKEHDGTYTKQTKRVTRDRNSSAVKYYRKNNPVVEEGPYLLVLDGGDFDETMTYEGLNGETMYMYFKKSEKIEEEICHE